MDKNKEKCSLKGKRKAETEQVRKKNTIAKANFSEFNW